MTGDVPSGNAARGPATARRPKGAAVITVYAVLLICIPAQMTIATLGGAGAPATLVGIGCLLLWIWDKMSRKQRVPIVAHGIRRAVLVLLAVAVFGLGVASRRATSDVEIQAGDLTFLLVASWLGVALLGGDTLTDRTAVTALLNRLAMLAGLFAALGLLQFVTGQPLVDQLQVPGLSLNQSLVSVTQRAGFNRPASTATHAIEFGVAVAMMLPLVVYTGVTRRGSFVRRWWPTALLGLAAALSVTRSALVCLVVGFLVLIPGLGRAARRNATLALLALSLIVFLAVPGMLATIAGLFTDTSDDTSIQSRTDSLEIVDYFFPKSPLIGRGFGTFLPRYRILDNQYLGILIDGGIIELTAVLGLFVVTIVSMQIIRRRTTHEPSRLLAQALSASVTVAAIGLALFDGFGFPLSSGLSFLVIALAGGLWRIYQNERLEPHGLSSKDLSAQGQTDHSRGLPPTQQGVREEAQGPADENPEHRR